MAHCIPAADGMTPPCAGSWRQIGTSLYPADAATARAAGLDFPPPAPAPAQAAPAPVPAPSNIIK